ncbi:AAA family ATPase [Polaribacter sp.]|uniref:AAA family ATPase n=1 Tax=Polaribacter sp. TaxID=1920175 RepID=UPI004047A8AE
MKNEGFEITKGIDLIESYKNIQEPKILWNGIVEGASGLITGVAKTGKTTFAENLAISLASGRKEFFGFPLDGKPRKVIFIHLEERGWRLVLRSKKMISELNSVELENFSENYFIENQDMPHYLNSDQDWEILRDYIISINPDVVFLDSLTHMCVGEIEKSSVAQIFTMRMKEYILSLNGVTIFTIHHNTKGNDKPMTQDNIAGSRIITQEFDFALGMGNIPTAKGGNYCVMLYNKDAIKDNTNGYKYTFNSNSWVQNIGSENLFNLYNEIKVDGRIDDKNKNLVYNYISSQVSQDSPVVLTSQLKKVFVENNTLTKQTMHTVLNKLEAESKIEKIKKGEYTLKIEINNGEGDSIQGS